METRGFLFMLGFFLSSIIFIIGAYLLQTLSKENKWTSQFVLSTKNTLVVLSLFCLGLSVITVISFR